MKSLKTHKKGLSECLRLLCGPRLLKPPRLIKPLVVGPKVALLSGDYCTVIRKENALVLCYDILLSKSHFFFQCTLYFFYRVGILDLRHGSFETL